MYSTSKSEEFLLCAGLLLYKMKKMKKSRGSLKLEKTVKVTPKKRRKMTPKS